jgi:hypothetical protein
MNQKEIYEEAKLYFYEFIIRAIGKMYASGSEWSSPCLILVYT